MCRYDMFCLIYVLYRPTTEHISRIIHIAEYSRYQIFAYNNNVSKEHLSLLRSAGICLYGHGLNVGLSKAYNTICKSAISAGYEYALILDQDTCISPDSIPLLLKHVDTSDESIGTHFSGSAPSSLSHILINSGFCVNLSSLQELGFYDESYFVEGVDFMLGLKALALNLTVRKIPTKLLDHKSLQDTTKLTILGVNLAFRIYPINRIKELYFSMFRLVLFCFSHRLPLRYSLYFLMISLASVPSLLVSLVFQKDA